MAQEAKSWDPGRVRSPVATHLLTSLNFPVSSMAPDSNRIPVKPWQLARTHASTLLIRLGKKILQFIHFAWKSVCVCVFARVRMWTRVCLGVDTRLRVLLFVFLPKTFCLRLTRLFSPLIRANNFSSEGQVIVRLPSLKKCSEVYLRCTSHLTSWRREMF